MERSEILLTTPDLSASSRQRQRSVIFWINLCPDYSGQPSVRTDMPIGGAARCRLMNRTKHFHFLHSAVYARPISVACGWRERERERERDVLFSDAVNCYAYTASVKDVWLRGIGGMILTGDTEVLWAKSWHRAALHTIKPAFTGYNGKYVSA